MSKVTVTLHQAGETSSKLSVGQHSITIDRPLEKGGHNEGPMGGQVLLMSVAGCFASTLYAAGDGRGLKIEDLQIEVHGVLSDDIPKRFEKLVFEVVKVNCDDLKVFEKLLKVAEKGCIAVNTIKAGMEVEILNNTLNP